METGMSRGQALALCVATSITGSLSLLGSGTIIYCILKEEFQSPRQNDARRQRQPRRRQPLLKRYLLTLSIADMLATTGFIMGVYAMPSSTQLPYAIGNVASCDVAGLLSNFLTAVVFANCNLSFYYLWIVQRQVQQQHHQQEQEQTSATTSFQNRMIISPNKERCMHALPFILAAIMIIVCMSLQGYNPRSLLRGCGLEMYPLECELEESMECTRGNYNGILGWVQMLLGVLPTCVGLFNTIVVYRTVTRMTHPNATTSTITITNTDHQQQQQQHLSHQQRRNRKIMIQCILYMASFLNSSLWPTFVAFAAKDRIRMSQAGGPFYILLFLTHLFLPLQGFFNLLIFKPKCIQHIFCYCRRRGTRDRNQSTTSSMRRLFDKVKQGFQDESEMPSTSNLAASMTTARTRRTTSTSINNNWQESQSGNTSFSMRDFSQSMSQSMNFQQSYNNNNSGITHHNYSYRYPTNNNNHSNNNSRRFSLTSIMSERSLFSNRNSNKNADNNSVNHDHDDADQGDVNVVVNAGTPIAPIPPVQTCTDSTPSPLQQWILDYNLSTTLTTGFMEYFHEENPRDFSHDNNNHNAADDVHDDANDMIIIKDSSLPFEINPQRAWSPRTAQRPKYIIKEKTTTRTFSQRSTDECAASNKGNHYNYVDDSSQDDNDNDNSNMDGSSSLPDDISSLQMSAVEGKPPPRQFPPLPLDLDAATPGPYLFGRSNHALVLHNCRDDDDNDDDDDDDDDGRFDEEILTTSTSTAESDHNHQRHHHDTADGGEGDEDTSLDNTTFNSAIQALQQTDCSLEISPSQRRRMLDLMMSASPTTQRHQQKEKQERGKDEDKFPPLPTWRDGVAPPSLQLPVLLLGVGSRVEQQQQQQQQQQQHADGEEDSSEDSLKRHFKLMQELH